MRKGGRIRGGWRRWGVGKEEKEEKEERERKGKKENREKKWGEG